MIKKINFTTVLALIVSINIAFAQFQVPTNYMPSSNLNQSNATNKPVTNSKVAKREIVNSVNQKNELDSLVNQRKSNTLAQLTTEEDSIKKAKLAFQNKIFGFCINFDINH